MERQPYPPPGSCVAKNSQRPASVETVQGGVPPYGVKETLVVNGKMMYKSSTATGVNNARLDMFARKQRLYQAIPPTRSALLQRVKRAAYQAGSIWSQSTLRQAKNRGLLTGDGRRMDICGM